jgi:RimJ/RimL family protein N-acetyltransferase
MSRPGGAPRGEAARAAWNEVEVRDLERGDLDAYIAYWHDASDPSLDALAVDRARMYPAKKMREMLVLQIERNAAASESQLSVLAVTFRGCCAGVHELTDLKRGEQAIMHAHLWRAHRGVGIGAISYVKAMSIYFERFALRTIVFETPKANAAANHLKRKLGVVPCGTGSIDLPFLTAPLETNTYRITQEELQALRRRIAVDAANEGA